MPTLSEGCSASCELTVTAQQPVALHVLEGDDCSGPEFACKRALAAAGSPNYISKISVPGAIGVPRPYTVVASEASSVDPVVRLDLSGLCVAACLIGGGDTSVRAAHSAR